MKKKLIYLSAFLLLFACSQTKVNYVAKVKLRTLSRSDMFNKEKVYDVIFDAEELDIDSLKNESRKMFLKGVNAYKNKKNQLAEAINYFKQSILIFPDAKAYYELGNALLDIDQTEKKLKLVDSVYDVAEHLDFQPSSILYFKKACVANLKKDKSDWEPINLLRQAFNNGFLDTALIMSDIRINTIVNTDCYKNLITDLQAGKFKGNTLGLFGVYEKSFFENKSFEVNFENIELPDYSRSISYDFANFIPEMQNTNFGRDVSHDYFYVAKVSENNNYVALIYKSISFWGQDMQPVITKLVTYDNTGNIIASKIFSAQFSAEKIKIGRIEGNTLYMADYKRIWKESIDKVSFEENTVEKYELIANAEFEIDDNGKIIEKSVPANYNDSSVFAKTNFP